MDPSQAVDCSSLPFLMDPSFEDNVLEGFLENMNSVASVQEAVSDTTRYCSRHCNRFHFFRRSLPERTEYAYLNRDTRGEPAVP